MIRRWWRPYGCDTCDVAWRGDPECWVCGETGVDRLLPIMNGSYSHREAA